MPVVKRPDVGEKTPARGSKKTTISIRRPLPKTTEGIIELISNLIRNRNITYMWLDSKTMSYDYISDILPEETVKWYLEKHKPK